MATVVLPRRRALALLLAPLAAFAARSAPSMIAAPAPTTRIDDALAISASDYCTDSQETAFLALINEHRANNGVGKLSISSTLGAAAEHHSKEMARYNYFSHTLRGGISWDSNIRAHAYKASNSIAENIAAGNSSAADTFRQWKNSPGHNKNMLNPNFRAIGIGRASKSTSKYRWYWTTTFGGALDSKAGRC